MNLAKHNDRWIALQVRQRKEGQVSDYLLRNGYEALLPRRHRCKRCSEKCSGEVLFPGYLFCRFDAQNRCRIVTAPGFIRFVGFGDTIPTLKQHELDNLRILEECSPCRHGTPLLEEGSPVKIVSGPLTGLRGIYVRTGKKGRLVLTVSLLGRSVSVELSDADVLQFASDENLLQSR